MDALNKVKAKDDYYDDSHLSRPGRDETLCGLKTTGSAGSGETTCVRCRQFAAGDF